uniref:uncharacterized protein LOC118546592 n=1 Tax=Halichoerus grypus TaxID=9711 RepID=UPI0016591607|nr:uncharacterized protein LOC118546592 [Halichoerus grypus]
MWIPGSTGEQAWPRAQPLVPPRRLSGGVQQRAWAGEAEQLFIGRVGRGLAQPGGAAGGGGLGPRGPREGGAGAGPGRQQQQAGPGRPRAGVAQGQALQAPLAHRRLGRGVKGPQQRGGRRARAAQQEVEARAVVRVIEERPAGGVGPWRPGEREGQREVLGEHADGEVVLLAQRASTAGHRWGPGPATLWPLGQRVLVRGAAVTKSPRHGSFRKTEHRPSCSVCDRPPGSSAPQPPHPRGAGSPQLWLRPLTCVPWSEVTPHGIPARKTGQRPSWASSFLVRTRGETALGHSNSRGQLGPQTLLAAGEAGICSPHLSRQVPASGGTASSLPQECRQTQGVLARAPPSTVLVPQGYCDNHHQEYHGDRIKGSAGPHSLQRLQGEPVPRLSRLLGDCWHSLFAATSPHSLPPWSRGLLFSLRIKAPSASLSEGSM